jgi:hypothetical protein
MFRIAKTFLPVMVLVLAASGARAASIQPKSLELDTRFSFQHTSVSVDLGDTDADYGVTVFDLNGNLGYFINSNFEVLGGLLINSTSVDDEGLSQFGLLASARYHFSTTGNVLPFVGLGLGFIGHGGDGPDGTEFILPELTGGVRFPFKDIVSMNALAGYRHRSTAFGMDDAGGNEFFLGFGLSVLLRGGVGE